MNSSFLKNLISSFVKSLYSEKGYSENTCRAYLHDLTEFASFIFSSWFSEDMSKTKADSFRADQVDGLMIRGYLGFLHKKNKKATIARKLSAIRSFFRYLVKHGVILENPVELILTPKQEQTIPAYYRP